MLVGYMRVSTAELNLALQRDALLAAGIASERVYDDTCSGILPDGIAHGELRPLRGLHHTAEDED